MKKFAIVQAGALLATAAMLSGCPNPNIYGSARTIQPGQLQHTLAAEGLAVVGSSGAASPTLPTYMLRIGLGEQVDLGLRLANLTSLGADVKWNFIRGSTDLALDPGFTGTYVSASASSGSSSSSASVGLFYLNLPLLVGFNLSENFTLLLSPGIGAAVATGTATSSSDDGVRFSGGSYGYARLGVGANFRLSSSFAIQPEITGLKSFSADGIILSFGIGISFGGMPRFQR